MPHFYLGVGMNIEQLESIRGAIIMLAVAIKAVARAGDNYDGRREAVEKADAAMTEIVDLKYKGLSQNPKRVNQMRKLMRQAAH